MTKKRIAILGATGSIGQSTIKIIERHPELFELVGIAADRNVEGLAQIGQRHEVSEVALFNEEAYEQAKKHPSLSSDEYNLTQGFEGLERIATLPDADIVVMAIVGTSGLRPTLAAIDSGKAVALASKEIMVLAGELVTTRAKAAGVALLPLDSEHSAIFQCLQGHSINSVEKLILTASGGAFRDFPLEKLETVTVEDALKHPTWDMGAKVTIDCATMANKGLELIEAKWLFDLPVEKLDVLSHPQSIIHCLVQFVDGNILTQMCPPDMTFPIQYALLHPERARATGVPLDLKAGMNLELKPVQMERYPCFKLAWEALNAGGCAPAVFNAANEAAVSGFIEKKLPFLKISEVVGETLKLFNARELTTLEEILEIHENAYTRAQSLVANYGCLQ
jgi:1-deoxy-D-xylulose-5-phosphate reductoisomerase